MATVTPNFNWPVPTSTDLVKDGATAIEALGDSIDASLVDLKGGTTGQVLAKASGTDMDFSWVAQDDSNAIQNSIVDAKGDLIAATANDTPARLAVGNNGETLVADSSTATGLRYTAGTVQSNPVLNSAFQVFQRGTSTAVTAPAFVADRWQAARDANASGITYSRQATGDTTNLPFVQYCLRVQRDNGTTGTGTSYLVQSMESINSIPFAGKTITYSFYARRGANYSAGSNLLGVIVAQGTGTDQNLLTAGYTGGTNLISSTATLTTTWQRFTFTGSVAAASTEIGLMFQFTPTGTAGAADYYEVTGVQIDIGSVALPFRTYAGTIQGELAACQRYFTLWASGSAQPIGMGTYLNSTQVNGTVALPVEMRTAPTLSIVTGTNYYRAASGGAGNDDFNSLTLDTCSTRAVRYYNASEAGGTSGQAAVLTTNNASAFLAFQAEL